MSLAIGIMIGEREERMIEVTGWGFCFRRNEDILCQDFVKTLSRLCQDFVKIEKYEIEKREIEMEESCRLKLFIITLAALVSEFDGLLGVLGISGVKGDVAEATIYENKESEGGKNLQIKDETELLFDLAGLKSKGIPNVGQICVKGTWLVYDSTDFVAKSKKEVGILSGDKVCGSLSDYGKVLSLQSVTANHDIKDNTISLFPDRDFGGQVHSIDSSKTSNPDAPPAQSLVTVGKQNWTLYPDLGDPFCLSPQGSDNMPICFMSKLIDGEDILSGKFVDIQKGCNEQLQQNKTIPLTVCTSYDTKKVLRIDDIGAKMQGRSFKKPVAPRVIQPSVCKTDGILDKDGLRLIRYRLTEDFSLDENFLWPKDKSRLWRLELLERSFHVLFATCPMDLVPKSYEQLIREIFIFQWDRALNQPTVRKNLTRRAIEEDRYYYLNRLLEECWDQAIAEDGQLATDIIKPALDSYANVAESDDWSEAIDPILMLNEDNDLVIETVWLIANHVAATCHHAMDFVVNFWADFIEMFNQMYLSVVEKSWTQPGNWNTAYRYALGGFEIKSMYNKLALCATASNNLVTNLDPFHRTYEVQLRKK